MSWGGRVFDVLWVPALLVSAGMLGEVGAEQATVSLPAPIIVTQVPVQDEAVDAEIESGLWNRRDAMDQARLIIVMPDGNWRVLSGGFDAACDPNVSFDGQHVLFAGRKERGGIWRIWEMGLNGEGLRAISPERMNARHPIYAATLFTLDSPEPWAATVFVGRETELNEFGRLSASSLYNVKLDGTDLRQVTFNPNHSVDPFQMWDGRVLYAAERSPSVGQEWPARFGLYAIHVEGTDMEAYGGELGQSIQWMPCATPGGLVVFIESDRVTADGAGQLACVQAQRPHVTYRALTSDPVFLFRSPAPLRDNRVLAARRSKSGRQNWGIVSFDADSRQCERVFDTPELHEVQAVLVENRKRPDGHSTVVDTKAGTGLFYGLNCYDADARFKSQLRPGTVKKVRFIEGVRQKVSATAHEAEVRGPFVGRRLIGEAPVEADGSFNVEVPADTPMLLQSLDEQGLALATCGWIWVKPKEKRGCIGCHEDPERVPENEYVLALRRPSDRLVLPARVRRTISFREDIAPILERHCAAADCHGGPDSPLPLALGESKPGEEALQKAYAALLKLDEADGTAGPPPHRYVEAGQARTSWLTWQLTGRNTSRLWDGDRAKPKAKISPMPPPGKGEPLTPEELRTIIQWIDLGAPYSASFETGSPGKTATP